MAPERFLWDLEDPHLSALWSLPHLRVIQIDLIDRYVTPRMLILQFPHPPDRVS